MRGGGSNESGREGDLHVAEDSVTLLQPVPPASVSFRPRSRSVVSNEGLRSFGIIATAFLPGLLLTRSLVDYLVSLRPSSSSSSSKLIMNMG